MTPSHRRTRTELLDALVEQLEFLQASSEGFDRGSEPEAARIAGVVRILVHKSRSNRALLDQLGVKRRLRYPLTGNQDTRQGMWRLQIWEDGGRMRGCYMPVGHERVGHASWATFDQWWTHLVLRDAAGNEFTRRDLVLLAADKDGHAHVDPVLPSNHADLAHRNSAGWRIGNNDEPSIPLEGNPLRVMIRQIGIELEAALEKGERWIGRPLARYRTPYVPPARWPAPSAQDAQRLLDRLNLLVVLALAAGRAARV